MFDTIVMHILCKNARASYNNYNDYLTCCIQQVVSESDQLSLNKITNTYVGLR